MGNDLGPAIANNTLDRHMVVLADPVSGLPYRVTGGGGGGSDPTVVTTFDTVIDAMADPVVLDAGITHIQTAGYYVVGIGAGMYKRVVPNPGLLGFQRLDGSYWKIIDDIRSVLALGAKINDNTFDNGPIIVAAGTRGGLMKLPAPSGADTYYIGTLPAANTITCSVNGLAIEGDGQGATIIRNRANSQVISMFTMTGDQQSMRHLTLYGDRPNVGGHRGDVNSGGVTALGIGFICYDVEFSNIEHQGIIFGAAAHYHTVDTCYFHDIGASLDIYGAGYKAVGIPGPTGWKVINCRFLNINGYTIPGPGGTDYGGGAMAPCGSQGLIDGNYISGCFNTGGVVAEQNGVGSQGLVRDWTLTNNVLIATSEPANAHTYFFELSGQNYTISGNIQEGGKGGFVVFLTDTGFVSGNATITANIIIGTANGVSFIEFGGPGHGIPRFVTIVGNKFKGQSGVAVDTTFAPEASQILVVGNEFSEVTTPIVDATAGGEMVVMGNTPAAVGIPWRQTNVGAAPTGGSGFAASAAYVKWRRDGHTVNFHIKIDIVANGTGAGAIQVTGLPFTFSNASVPCGKSGNGQGVVMACALGGNSGLITTSAGSYPGATGITINVEGTVEVA